MGELTLQTTLQPRGPAAAVVLTDEQVTVTLALDEAPREVELPEALEAGLAADGAAKATFDALAYSHRKEYARWIAEAKKDETRERRVAQALQRLREGKTR